jgi:LPXTG-motif cell wall-anchored protein
MGRIVALFLAVSLLALPGAAMAQGAGDEQYQDPFGQTDQSNGSQDQPAPEPDTAPAPAAPAAPAEQAVTAQQAAAPTLPRTGFPAYLLASAGAMLLASGAALRRRVS